MRYMQGISVDSPLWFDGTVDEDENYNDDYEPSNNGRTRPCVYEWGDYIAEEQEHYVAGVCSGEIKLPSYKQHRHSPEEILLKLAEFPKLLEQGMTIILACACLGITPETYRRWVGEYENITIVGQIGFIQVDIDLSTCVDESTQVSPTCVFSSATSRRRYIQTEREIVMPNTNEEPVELEDLSF